MSDITPNKLVIPGRTTVLMNQTLKLFSITPHVLGNLFVAPFSFKRHCLIFPEHG